MAGHPTIRPGTLVVVTLLTAEHFVLQTGGRKRPSKRDMVALMPGLPYPEGASVAQSVHLDITFPPKHLL